MIQAVWLVIFSFVLHTNCKKVNGIYSASLVHTYRNVSELIKYRGYPFEEHSVLTPDGYILSVKRIPHGRKNNTKDDKKGVVLLVHGVFTDSTIWVFKSPDESLGFILPDKGYDTWLLNTRGCNYSKKHIKYKTNEYKFWDFSFDEVAKYDVPSTIDYILKATGEESLYLISNSQGSTASFAMLSEMLNYNKKVKLHIAIAPVTSVGAVATSARFFAPFATQIAFVINLFSSGEYSLSDKFNWMLQEGMCTVDDQEFCDNLFFSFVGEDKMQVNKTTLLADIAQCLSSTSTKSLVHYAQLVGSKNLRKYDYGYRNKKFYNQDEPPEYDLSRITTPVALISSTSDPIANSKDMDILRRTLKSLVFDYSVPKPYNHVDYFLAEDIPKLIFEPVLKLLLQY